MILGVIVHFSHRVLYQWTSSMSRASLHWCFWGTGSQVCGVCCLDLQGKVRIWRKQTRIASHSLDLQKLS